MAHPPGAVMPDFEITSPDGRKFIVTAPDGASPEDVLRFAHQNMPSAEQQQAQPGGFMRGVGLGTRAAVHGLAALPGMAYDVAAMPFNLIYKGIEAAGGPSIPRINSARGNIGAVADVAGLPSPQTSDERLTSAVVEGMAGVPTSMGAGTVLQGAKGASTVAQNIGRVLTAAPTSQVVGAGTGAAASQLVGEAGGGIIPQMAASLAGGVAGAGAVNAAQSGGRLAAAALIDPFTEAGRQRTVAEMLLRTSSDPRNLGARATAGVADVDARLPGAVPTLGTAARDPALLKLESSIKAGAIGPQSAGMLADTDFARTALRAKELATLSDGQTSGARGAEIRSLLNAEQLKMKGHVNRAYEAVDPDGVARFDVSGLRAVGRDVLNKLFGPGSGGPPAELVKALDDLPKASSGGLIYGPGRQIIGREPNGPPPPVDWRFMQNLRSQLGGIGGKAAASGDAPTAAAAKKIADALEEAALKQVEGTADAGLIGRWQEATAMRRQMGEMFDRAPSGASATGNILAEDRFGRPKMPEERVAPTAVSRSTQSQQVMTAGGAVPVGPPPLAADQLREQMRGQFMDDLVSKVRTSSDVISTGGAAQRNLSLAGFQRFMDQNNGQVRDLFNPEQANRLDRLARDVAEGSFAANTGAAKGSQTSQNMTVANILSRASNGLIDPAMPLAQTLGTLGGVLKVVYSSPEQATKDLLVRALADPEFGKMLVSKATPAALDRAIGYVDANMLARMLKKGGEGAARQGIRTATDPLE